MSQGVAGLRLLITRDRASAAGAIAALEADGARVDARPVIAFESPREPDAARGAIRGLAGYDWLVFTSANGVRFLARLCEAEGVGRPRGLRVAAIGKATASAAAAAGWHADFIATRGAGAGFGAELAPTVGAGGRVLVARPEVGRPELSAALRAAGVCVDEVIVYRTVAAKNVASVAADLVGGGYDAIVFTAPSTVEHLLACTGAVRQALAAMQRIAIGPTTADAMRHAGLPATALAERPDAKGIRDAVAAAAGASESARAVLPSAVQGSGERLVPDNDLRQTPLHDVHVAAGGRMVAFAGWRMPVQYRGVVDEHKAVRTRAGLFDVSHMGELFVSGAGAEALLQRLTCNNVARLAVGRAHYTGLMTPAGTFHDDMLVYRLAADAFMLVLNAANTTTDVAWIREHAGSADVTLDDRSGDTALLALQGPAAATILAGLVARDLGGVRYYAFVEDDVCGARSIVSRTGYTGEDGFELYVPAEAAADIWAALMAAGAPHGLEPIGLAARDTLRLEARMALYGNDIDDTTTALEADLGWIVKFKKGDFIGRDALVRQRDEGIRRKLIGFAMRGRGIARHGYPVLVGEREVGRVTSGTFAPFLEKSIGLAYLPIDESAVGTEFGVGIRGRVEPAVVVETPFYKRPE